MVAHNKVAIDGYLGGPSVERWSVTLSYGSGGGPLVTDPADIQNWAEAVRDYLAAANLTGLMSMVSIAGAISGVRTYYYGPSGPAVAAGGSTLTTPKAGTGTSSRPPQVAATVSLLTGLAGRRYRGRFYWPWLNGAVNQTTLKSAVPGTAPTEAAAMLNGIGAAAAPIGDLVPVVHSLAGGFVTPVTEVRIGDVCDTQRRRRDNLVESYLSASV